MATVTTYPYVIDMQSWGYYGLQSTDLRQVTVASGEITFTSAFDPQAGASVLRPDSYITQVRLRGTGFGDFDGNGVPHSGTITGASLFGGGSLFLVAFDQLSMPVSQFLTVLGSRDAATMRSGLLAGNDDISGGYLAGASGAVGSRLMGEAGNDTITGHGARDTLDGGSGDDRIDPANAVGSATIADGGTGADTLQSYLGSDTLNGGDGADQLIDGVGGGDQLSGGAGDDTIMLSHNLLSPGGANTLLDGGVGNDTISSASNYSLQDLIRINGGDGADTIRVISGYRYTIDAGAGADTVSLEGAMGLATVTLGAGADRLQVLGLIAGSPSITVTDFAAEDSLELDTFLAVAGYAANAFSQGVLRLAQQGADAVVQTRFGAAADWTDAVRLQGFDVRGLSVGAGAGTPSPLSLLGGDGSDTLTASADFRRIEAGAGDDSVVGGDGEDYLRGGEGRDVLRGGASFDDLNGNQGEDTIWGGLGADWVVGGKDLDLLSGDEGDDIVYGNLGDDWCDGGAGDDIVRGGQGNDRVLGQAGNDWLSGDRGDDTIVGGTGADIFHGSQDAGLDLVMDFNAAEGDRVQLDPGTTYTLRQDGADTIIDMGGGHQMVLLKVQLSSLAPGWIFGA